MDYLKIEQLEISVNQGCEDTKNIDQNILINAKLYYDISNPGISDRIEDTIQYEKLCKFIQRFLAEHHFCLMEAAVEQTARTLLQEFPKLKAVELSGCKPKNLAGQTYGNVTMSVFRKWNRVYLSIGAGGKDKEAALNNVIDALFDDGCCRVTAVSRFMEVEFSGSVEQGDSLYGCVEIETMDTPQELLAQIHKIEAEAQRHGDSLEIDILLYNEEIIQEPDLTIPPMDLHRKPAFLEPLNQIAPYAVHPVKKTTISELIENIKEQSGNTGGCAGCGGCPIRKN